MSSHRMRTQADVLQDTRPIKVSGTWNSSHTEEKYRSGWTIPDDPGFINYIRETWLHTPPGLLHFMPIKSYSQYGEDIYVKELLKDRRNGFFLEAGALDGVRFSNTLNLELANDWTGLLIEADPTSFSGILKHKRNAYSINACISGGKSEMLSFVHNTDELAIATLEDTNRYHQ